MRLILTALLPFLAPAPALSAPCGGDFRAFTAAMAAEAQACLLIL